VEQQAEQTELRSTLRQRQQILSELRVDSFNYLIFTSKSEKTTEELAALFFPETTLFESQVLLLKPTALHLLNEVKDCLTQLRYHTIFSKTVQLSKNFAEELLGPLRKVGVGR
jgi:hypothetical protein